MDIHHIATMLPYADVIITDKCMKRYVKDFKYDKKYKTRVFYIGDTEELGNYFPSI